MASLSLGVIENRIKTIAGQDAYDSSFLLELLLIFGKSQSTVTRLRNSGPRSLNVAAEPDREIALKRVVYYREISQGEELLEVLENLRTAEHVLKHSPRFVIVSDCVQMAAWDTKTSESLLIPIRDIDRYFTFFLPWAGMEKTHYTNEAHADVRAAERMGKLFDELLEANPGLKEPDARHGLNVFFTRLLFCFFAEDTGVFEEGLFTNAIASHTLKDGSDTQQFLADVFDALDTQKAEDKKPYLAHFPYVNGRLFTRQNHFEVPSFTPDARKHLIELGSLGWQEINPDIFGSMFQAVVDPTQRSDLGQHYTSVPNILKTIEPLFLDELKEKFNEGYNSVRKLKALRDRISKIRVFDPACGSGNFLVIAYKELRKLEHMILERLSHLDADYQTLFEVSQINIENFYGIEIDDFPAEVAVLSLWIAKHQMNCEFQEKFGVDIPLIPLKEHGNIVAGNACRIDWNEVCPNNGTDEIYLIGNPPYLGAKLRSPSQKADYPPVFGNRKIEDDMDYIGLWFIKGADYIAGTAGKLAFVSTNSITQGIAVSQLFPIIWQSSVEVSFAYSSFKWANNARKNAGVTVVVIGLRNRSNEPKYLYSNTLKVPVRNINGYLVDGPDLIVFPRSKPISSLPLIIKGSQPTDAKGQLSLTPQEMAEITTKYPETKPWIRHYSGSNEFINGVNRYCLWLSADDFPNAKRIPELQVRFERITEERRKSPYKRTRECADEPYRFEAIRHKPTPAILIPSHSSESREYVPIGYVGSETVISNAAFAVYDAEPWLFAILTSKMHMVWLRTIGGKLKTDYRYSNKLVYNTFPIPHITEHDKERLTEAAFRILDVREYHCGATLADLYDPGKMPENLLTAHQTVDNLVDEIFAGKPLESDEERLKLLFKLYQKAIEQEEESKPKRR